MNQSEEKKMREKRQQRLSTHILRTVAYYMLVRKVLAATGKKSNSKRHTSTHFKETVGIMTTTTTTAKVTAKNENQKQHQQQHHSLAQRIAM